METLYYRATLIARKMLALPTIYVDDANIKCYIANVVNAHIGGIYEF
jgi:hypothetical protein